jgi:hypothetical protein
MISHWDYPHRELGFRDAHRNSDRVSVGEGRAEHIAQFVSVARVHPGQFVSSHSRPSPLVVR